jgi:hypothetical protein
LGSKPQQDPSEAVDAVEVTIKLHVKNGMQAITEHANYFGSELGKLLIEHTGRADIGLEIVRSLGLPDTTPIRIRAVPVSAELQGNAIEFKEAAGTSTRVPS